MICNLGHPMSLRHPVWYLAYRTHSDTLHKPARDDGPGSRFGSRTSVSRNSRASAPWPCACGCVVSERHGSCRASECLLYFSAKYCMHICTPCAYGCVVSERHGSCRASECLLYFSAKYCMHICIPCICLHGCDWYQCVVGLDMYCMYICKYIYICIHTYIFIYVYIHTNENALFDLIRIVYICMYMYIYLYICMYTHLHIYIQTRMRMRCLTWFV